MILEIDTPWPAEMPISSNSNRRQCHEKSCHCVSEYWLFGRYERDNKITSQVERDFGKQFRLNNAQFVKNGQLPVELGV